MGNRRDDGRDTIGRRLAVSLRLGTGVYRFRNLQECHCQCKCLYRVGFGAVANGEVGEPPCDLPLDHLCKRLLRGCDGHRQRVIV